MNETKHTPKKYVVLLILILCLFGLTLIHQAKATPECVSVTELIKNWNGNWLSSVTGVTITLSNGTVVWNDGIGTGGQIDIKGIWQGQTATIAWTDGNGKQTETIGPLYPADECHGSGAVVVVNSINHPTVLTHQEDDYV